MIPVRIEGCTGILGKPMDWDESLGCVGLPFRREYDENGNGMLRSRWQPSSEELQIILAGGAIELVVLGDVHPPVWLVIQP